MVHGCFVGCALCEEGGRWKNLGSLLCSCCAVGCGHPSHWPKNQVVLGLSLTKGRERSKTIYLVLALTDYVRAKLVILTNYM
jgi:hypothetical protein